MNSNNDSGGNNKTSNPQSHVSESSDKQQQSLKVDNESSYGKNVHDTKTDVQQTPTTAPGFYHHQTQDQYVDASIPAPTLFWTFSREFLRSNQPSNDGDVQQNQMVNDLAQSSIDSNETETQSPSKVN